MPFEIDPNEFSIEPLQYETGLNVFAFWQSRKVGHAACYWENERKTRLLIADLEVFQQVVIKRRRFFSKERLADFRGKGIGTMLIREVIRQAPLIGARELFGKVVKNDLDSCPFLLDFYSREGFQIGETDPGDSFPPDQIARISMQFGSGSS